MSASIADAIRASVDASIAQLPIDGDRAAAVRAAANNAAAVLLGDPVGMILAALSTLDGARTLTVRMPGNRIDIEISCESDAACRDIASIIGAPIPETRVLAGMAWTYSTRYLDERATVTVCALRAAVGQERAA